jgi:hypothetical protein
MSVIPSAILGAFALIESSCGRDATYRKALQGEGAEGPARKTVCFTQARFPTGAGKQAMTSESRLGCKGIVELR